jgi:hypothetical protein
MDTTPQSAETEETQPTEVEVAKPSIVEQVSASLTTIQNDGKGFGEQKPEDKSKKDKNAKKMRKWPSNPSATVAYGAIISPIKKILEDGYRLIRKKEKTSFEYDGLNLGKQERKLFPPPNYQLSQKLLELNEKDNRSLFDVMLHVVFCLGIEQGRRVSRPEYHALNKALSALEKYRRDNRKLRFKVDQLDARMKLKLDLPDVSGKEFEYYLKQEMDYRRKERFEIAKKELGEDPMKALRVKEPNRLVFSELVKVAKTCNDTCTKSQWKAILKDLGWNMSDWNNRCKHQNVRFVFKSKSKQ